jgi:hypothetical protein
VATEKQIAPNRANAKRSTGPKTAAGRLRSSRNAFRQRLSCPLQLDFAMSEKVNAIARILAGEAATDEQLRWRLPTRRWSCCESAGFAPSCWLRSTSRVAIPSSSDGWWRRTATNATHTPSDDGP